MEPKHSNDSKVILSHLMQPHHANPGGIVHGGEIMKEIDNAAVAVAVKHSRTLAVTASIDRIDFHNMVFIGNLVSIKASLNRAWKTSMEVGVRVEAEDLLSGKISHVGSAYLTFVAITDKGKPIEVPEYEPITDDEKRRFIEAENRKKLRLQMKAAEKECQNSPGKCKL